MANAASDEDDSLTKDPRWELVRRVVASSGFRRAAQLRGILLYVSRFALLHPGEHLREQDIACNVLGRRNDFDPAYDNIVRVQISHLRRKLSDYFANEGAREQLILDIPKGSYVAQFLPAPNRKSHFPFVGPETASETDSPEATAAPKEGPPLTSAARPFVFPYKWVAILLALALLSICSFLLLHRKSETNAMQADVPPILMPMVQNGKDVSVVLPDTSLMVLQEFLRTEVTPQEYLSSDFPTNELGKIPEEGMRQVLSFLGRKRTTSISEVEIGMDCVDTFRKSGLRANVRYPRDLHVRDFDNVNVVLIGSRRSNPWLTLFDAKTNFRFVESTADHSYYFLNAKPHPGEQQRYQPDYGSKEAINYTDVALIPNLTGNGFVLLVDGSDVQGNEAATRFLLHSKLPPALLAELKRKDLSRFEVFLRGTHMQGEANDAVEVIAYRAEQN